MEGKKEAIISFLTRGQVAGYKVWLALTLVMWILLALYGCYRTLADGGGIGAILWGGLIGIQVFRIYRGIKPVEFDREFLYVSESGYEVVVPLDNIKKVEIKSLGGLYKVIFHDAIQSGREIYFKPSVFYPLDFWRQDKKVNILRAYAWKAKQQRKPLPKNALGS